MSKRNKKHVRNLVVVLGDQLDERSAAFDGFDKSCDAVWMAEVGGEATYVWSHKARIAIFLSAMRHFRNDLRRRRFNVVYRELDEPENAQSLPGELEASIKRLKPERLVLVKPGEWRVEKDLMSVAQDLNVPLEVRPDRHFLSSLDDFNEFAEGRKQLRLENFYRERRKVTGVLMEGDGPAGGQWNLDTENRKTFGKEGPGDLPVPKSFRPDKTTREVLKLVEERFGKHPGSLANFDWPVTPKQASAALDDFIEHRLHRFGPFEDAMWTDMPYGYHSRLSSALNLKLLNPRPAIETAEKAYRNGRAPLNSVEGFVRQILGWREYIRGVYWRFMPEYESSNVFKAETLLPPFYWTAETDMACLRETIGQTLAFGFAHHIQRLMVTGLFALLLGVDPHEVHKWYLAIYVDAVEWVEMPNVLGMSQYADGGLLASKPYAATGKYVKRMSNYCGQCRYDPGEFEGDKACPFTTLYWDFLMRHEKLLGKNPRMSLQLRNLERLDRKTKNRIRKRSNGLRNEFCK